MILLNPGPVNVSDRVRQAAAGEPLCHREPEYFDLQDEARERLLKSFSLSSEHAAVLLAGSGTSAVEAMICSGVPAGKSLLVVNNGVYGDRMTRMARAHGIPVREVRFAWETPADPKQVAAEARNCKDLGAVAVVHHETTTGLINPVAELAKTAGVRLLVDSVSGLAGDAIDVASTDFCAGTAGKCIQGLPGVSFVFVRRSLLADAPTRSVYLDLADLCAKQDKRNTPFTPAVPAVAAMVEALLELEEEGLDGRIARFRGMSDFLRSGFADLNLDFWLPAELRSNTLTTLRLPKGRTYPDLHDALKAKGFVIYAGQGDLEREAFRIANMGWIPQKELARLLETMKAWLAS